VLTAVRRFAAEAAGVPIVLYNPPHAKTQLSPLELGRLAAAVPELIGVKVFGGDAAWYAEVRRHCGDLAVFVTGHTLATGIGQGAHGAYSNVACLSPSGAAAWYQTMLADPAAAVALEERIVAFLDRHIIPLARLGYSNAALDKALAATGGWAPIGTATRWPFRSVPAEVPARLAAVVRAELPELFAG